MANPLSKPKNALAAMVSRRAPARSADNRQPEDAASILELTQAVSSNDTQDDFTMTGGGSFKKIIGLMGVTGGVGTTSLAIQMAYDLVKQGGRKGPSVALIDLDFENGSCAAYLDIEPRLKHKDLNEDPERIDAPLTAALLNRHESGIHVLAAKNRLAGNDAVNADTVLAILDTVCDMFDIIILDIPQLWRPWNHAAIGASDQFALLTELSIPGIHKTRHKMEAIEKMIPSMAGSTEVILTKMERRTFKNEIKLNDALKILERPLTGAICIDGNTTLSALNRGTPAGTISPVGRYVKDTRNVLDFWKDEQRDFAQHIVK